MFQIAPHTFYLLDGTVVTKFFIQKKKRFLFWTYWVTIGSTENTRGYLLSFDSIQEAVNCIDHLNTFVNSRLTYN